MSGAQELRTARLRLRRWQPDDEAAMAQINQARVGPWTGPRRGRRPHATMSLAQLVHNPVQGQEVEVWQLRRATPGRSAPRD